MWNPYKVRVGMYVVRRLMKSADKFIWADFVEVGSSVMGVVHVIADRHRAIFVDCAYMEEPAGSIRRFVPEDVVPQGVSRVLDARRGPFSGTSVIAPVR